MHRGRSGKACGASTLRTELQRSLSDRDVPVRAGYQHTAAPQCQCSQLKCMEGRVFETARDLLMSEDPRGELLPGILAGMTVTARRHVKPIGTTSVFKKFMSKYWYPFLSRRWDAEDVLLMNYGYDEDPPMGLPLDASDEPHRFSVQLYHRVATQVDLEGKKVLEVSCGHGGGSSYVVRTLGPASYTGLDINPDGIAFCKKLHNQPGLDFVHGDAQNLPFDDQTFDAVVNVEASQGYPDFPASGRSGTRAAAGWALSLHGLPR